MHLIAVAALVVAGAGAGAPLGRCPTQTPRPVPARELTNEELIAALRPGNFERVTAAVAEIARRGEPMIPRLAALKGCRETFFGGGLGNRMSAQLIPERTAADLEAIPLEQAAIYLIVGIYRGTLEHAQSPYFVDVRGPRDHRVSVSPRLNARAWQSVDRWIAKWRASNLAALRRWHDDPLAGSKLAFW